MLGNSPERRFRCFASWPAFAAFVLLLVAGCARTVKQDAKTGKDGKYKGAKAITLEADEGDASGIVTYPGGDRVDWKLIELPKDKRGTVELELSWKPPRPGLDLAFDVYDEYGTKLGGVKPKKPSAARNSKKKRGKKSLTLENVKGKVYVEVYASNRGDAGKYKLSVKFAELVANATPVFDPGAVPIPDPPKLAAVPPPCDPTAIDAKNPECKGVSPPCDPAKPDKTNPNCSGVATPCDPNALDPTNPSCIPLYPECDPLAIDAKNPKCKGVTKPKAKPVDGVIINVDVNDSGTIITINKGKKEGVDRGWTGEIVSSGGKGISNGDFTVFRVTERQSFAKVKISRDTVNNNLKVKLYPTE